LNSAVTLRSLGFRGVAPSVTGVTGKFGLHPSCETGKE
jgi:hypothetical protein